jgi:hypothetical protein
MAAPVVEFFDIPTTALVFETYYLPFLAVLADSLKSLAVGAPAAPGLRIFSPEPAAMRFCLA